MSIAEEERFLVAARLYEAEKALLERLAPPGCSWVEIREFVYYHMYGEEMPEGAASRLERHGFGEKLIAP